MTLVDNIVTFSKNVQALLETNKAILGLSDVYYADQNRIPRTPTACVEPSTKTRDLEGLPRRAQTVMQCVVLVYHNPISSSQVAAPELDDLTEHIETVLHLDARMGGTVTDSMVRTIEYGYASRNNTLFRTSRIVFEAQVKVILPSSP